MDESILTSVKRSVGVVEECTDFDAELIMHTNTVLTILTQLGVGPATGFSIATGTEKWSDFITDMTNLHSIKSYVGLKVRLLFDPPTSSAVVDSLNRLISELEWRINVTVDPGDSGEEGT